MVMSHREPPKIRWDTLATKFYTIHYHVPRILLIDRYENVNIATRDINRNYNVNRECHYEISNIPRTQILLKLYTLTGKHIKKVWYA